VLNALESVTDVKVISSPKLTVLNNQSATLQVGDEVPVPSASAVSTNDINAPIVNSIQYRNTGIILTVTPRINNGGLVLIDVEQEVSDVTETASSGIDAPTIQQRRITSTIAANDGETIALGGLIRSTENNVKSGVPFLKDIPVIGNAFSDTDIVERRSELIVLLTPRIIQDNASTKEVMTYLQGEFRSLFKKEE
jgi:general secretion pathway protein D